MSAIASAPYTTTSYGGAYGGMPTLGAGYGGLSTGLTSYAAPTTTLGMGMPSFGGISSYGAMPSVTPSLGMGMPATTMPSFGTTMPMTGFGTTMPTTGQPPSTGRAAEISSENERLRRENELLKAEVEKAKKQIRNKVQRIHTENDVLRRDNVRMQMLIAEVRRIREVRANLDKESSELADEYESLAEENEELRERLARADGGAVTQPSPLVAQPIRVEPGKAMLTPRQTPAILGGSD